MALGWNPPPAKPHSSYSRLSRYGPPDCCGFCKGGASWQSAPSGRQSRMPAEPCSPIAKSVRHEAQPRCVAQLSCINSPSTPHTIKVVRAVAARYSAIVMIAPVDFRMSEILLAIASIPRREQGNFSTPRRRFLDRSRPLNSVPTRTALVNDPYQKTIRGRCRR
jgi:hypothetical protein